MIRILLLLFLLLTNSSAFASEAIAAQLKDFSYLKAKFIQERQLSNPSITLRSTGKLLLSPKDGLWWQQEEPFGMTLLLTDTSMLQQLEGEAAQPLAAGGNAQMQQFQRLLRDLLVVDLQALNQHFSLTSLPTETTGWKLKLEPKTSPLNQLFAYFELTGDQVVRRLIMKDNKGDSTTIRFSLQQLSHTPLTEDERAVFYP